MMCIGIQAATHWRSGPTDVGVAGGAASPTAPDAGGLLRSRPHRRHLHGSSNSSSNSSNSSSSSNNSWRPLYGGSQLRRQPQWRRRCGACGRRQSWHSSHKGRPAASINISIRGSSSSHGGYCRGWPHHRRRPGIPRGARRRDRSRHCWSRRRSRWALALARADVAEPARVRATGAVTNSVSSSSSSGGGHAPEPEQRQ